MKFDLSKMSSGVEPGIYEAECIDAVETESSNGNDMLQVEWRLDLGNGKSRIVRDWLVNVPQALFKVEELCEVLDLDPNALTPEDLIGSKIAIRTQNKGADVLVAQYVHAD